MKTIVVGYDGSDQGRDALALSARLAGCLEAGLVVAVVDEFPVLLDRAAALEGEAGNLKSLLQRAADELGEHEFSSQAMRGSVPECLELIVSNVSADVLVIGSTCRAEFGEVMPGSVGDRLLSGAPCALALAPNGYASREATDGSDFGHIGVGYDGEPESAAAARYAIEMAAAAGAAVELIAVSRAPTELLSGMRWRAADPYLRFLREQLNAEVEAACRQQDADVEVTGRVIDGDPAEVLREASGRLSLLLLGSRGYGPLHRVFLGGVSIAVLRGASCPVLITPRSAPRSRLSQQPALQLTDE